MTDCDAECLDAVGDFLGELGEASLWIRLALSLPAFLLCFALDSGVLFLLCFLGACLLAGNSRAAGWVGWLGITVLLVAYFHHPVPGHFIELLLRLPPRGGMARSSEQVQAAVPVSLSAKVGLALAFAALGGLLPGLALGWVAGLCRDRWFRRA